jgi:glycosyltransferase involved in cell wall biosynthesis
MASSACSLIGSFDELQLAVVSFSNGVGFQEHQVGRIKYYVLPVRRSSYCKCIAGILESFEPDVVHIHGTEYPHSLDIFLKSNQDRVVVSIQGLVSVYAQHYFGGISSALVPPSIRDMVRMDDLRIQKLRMANRGRDEVSLLGMVKHVIGRTKWDRSHAYAVNPNVTYHHCDETMRPTFYQREWNYGKCEKHRIFLSQAHYPIKGLHQVVRMLKLVQRLYPDVHVYVAGYNFLNSPWWKQNGYARYLSALMKDCQVADKFTFLGSLNETQMADQFELAHVFISPSAIENSPNSVCEAQIIGTPVVASFVGGVSDLVTHELSGMLYPFEEWEMMAYYVSQLFDSSDLCRRLSAESKKVAIRRNDPTTNALTLRSIYESIVC